MGVLGSRGSRGVGFLLGRGVQECGVHVQGVYESRGNGVPRGIGA